MYGFIKFEPGAGRAIPGVGRGDVRPTSLQLLVLFLNFKIKKVYDVSYL